MKTGNIPTGRADRGESIGDAVLPRLPFAEDLEAAFPVDQLDRDAFFGGHAPDVVVEEFVVESGAIPLTASRRTPVYTGPAPGVFLPCIQSR